MRIDAQWQLKANQVLTPQPLTPSPTPAHPKSDTRVGGGGGGWRGQNQKCNWGTVFGHHKLGYFSVRPSGLPSMVALPITRPPWCAFS